MEIADLLAVLLVVAIPLAYIGFLALIVFVLVKVAMFALGWS
jgi:hypothetical protein